MQVTYHFRFLFCDCVVCHLLVVLFCTLLCFVLVFLVAQAWHRFLPFNSGSRTCHPHTCVSLRMWSCNAGSTAVTADDTLPAVLRAPATRFGSRTQMCKTAWCIAPRKTRRGNLNAKDRKTNAGENWIRIWSPGPLMWLRRRHVCHPPRGA